MHVGVRSREMTGRSLVMAIAINYPLEYFRIFVGTLRASGYAGDVALVVTEAVGVDIASYCREHGVELRNRTSVGLADPAAARAPAAKRKQLVVKI